MKIDASSIDNIPKKIRCYILSLLPSDIWMIQKTFNDMPSVFDKDELLVAMELSLSGVQVCVRNNEVIKGNSIKVKRIFNPIKRKQSGKLRYLG